MLNACNQGEFEPNYDESRVPDYTLPELLKTEDGNIITEFSQWRSTRRPELLKIFEKEMYGFFPDSEYKISFKENILADSFLNNRAILKEITAEVTTENGSEEFTILYVFPKDQHNVPVFAGLNFAGNHTVNSFPAISIPKVWVMNSEKRNITGNQASESSRGSSSSRWPISMIIENGYGVATTYYGEFDPDYDDGFKNGFHPLFATEKERNVHSPGSISVWAKGMSLIADYLYYDSIADPSSIIAIGHSRLGKTALWCGANDERFAAVISNNSGCGGAALSRRAYGETVGRINNVFPHWFCDRFKKYNQREHKLPIDQHMLLALIAPRPVYVASALEDQWADPRGEFLALKAALPVYELSSAAEINFPEQMPPADKPIFSKTGYHSRSGGHDITEYDWLMYIKWCNKWLSK
ncbi:MAG: acetylxylan esterase [Bacteroidales bacterium]|nr:acetylxylan esterase [Bacteroidales bacterium]